MQSKGDQRGSITAEVLGESENFSQKNSIKENNLYMEIFMLLGQGNLSKQRPKEVTTVHCCGIRQANIKLLRNEEIFKVVYTPFFLRENMKSPKKN